MFYYFLFSFEIPVTIFSLYTLFKFLRWYVGIEMGCSFKEWSQFLLPGGSVILRGTQSPSLDHPTLFSYKNVDEVVMSLYLSTGFSNFLDGLLFLVC